MPQTTAGVLARRHRLTSAAHPAAATAYAGQLWSFRHFIWEFAGAKLSAALGGTRLGMLWQVLTPLINAGLYYVIFGWVLKGHHDVQNFTAYLCIGVFVFGYTQSVVQAGAQAINGNLGLIRALYFPRATMPISVGVAEARNMTVSMAVLATIVLLTGEPITVRWMQLLPVLALQTVFNAGLAMLVARLGATVRDLPKLLPFIMRIWMYGSAAVFPVDRYTDALHGWKLAVAEANPMLAFIELHRHALMKDIPHAAPATQLWLEAALWTVLVGLGGFLYFWHGEKSYGRG